MRRLLASGGVAVLTAALVILAPTASYATQCSGGRQVDKVANESTRFTQAKGDGSSVTGGPGVTLKSSRTKTFKVSGSISDTREISAGRVIAAVKRSLNVTIQASRSGKSSVSGEWTVPRKWKIGRLAIGSIKYKGSVRHYVENRNCKLVKVGDTALYNAPKGEWHFQRSRVK